MYWLKDFYILDPGEGAFDFFKGSLLIKEGLIDKVWKQGEEPAVPAGDGLEIIDGKFRRLIFPGFIQVHTHLGWTLNQGAKGRTSRPAGYDGWAYEAALDRQQVGRAVIAALKQLVGSGTTAVLDLGSVRQQEVIFELMTRARFRYTGGKMMPVDVPDLPDALLETEDEAIKESLRLSRIFHQTGDHLVHFALSPVLGRGAGSAFLAEVKNLSDDQDLIIHARLPVSRHFSYLDKLGILNGNTVIARLTGLQESEKDILVDVGASMALSPGVQEKTSGALPPVAELLERGIKLGLGCGWMPAPHSLSVFPDMRLIGCKTGLPDGSNGAVSAEDVLRLVSIRGAEIIKMGDRVGRIARGLDADLVILDMDTAETAGFQENPCAAVVFLADAGNVAATMVRGRFLFKDGRYSEAIEALERGFSQYMRVLE